MPLHSLHYHLDCDLSYSMGKRVMSMRSAVYVHICSFERWSPSEKSTILGVLIIQYVSPHNLNGSVIIIVTDTNLSTVNRGYFGRNWSYFGHPILECDMGLHRIMDPNT